MSKRLKLLFAAFAVATVIISVILLYPLYNGNDEHENDGNGNDDHENNDNGADFLFSFGDGMQGVNFKLRLSSTHLLSGHFSLLQSIKCPHCIFFEQRFCAFLESLKGWNCDGVAYVS